jgi:hypothetical protein
MLAAGVDATGGPALRQAGWLSSLGAVLASTYFLVNAVGRPERFHHICEPRSRPRRCRWGPATRVLTGFATASALFTIDGVTSTQTIVVLETFFERPLSVTG